MHQPPPLKGRGRLSDGLGSALNKGQICSGTVLYSTERKRFSGLQTESPSQTQTKTHALVLFNQTPRSKCVGILRDWWDLSCFFFGLLNADWACVWKLGCTGRGSWENTPRQCSSSFTASMRLGYRVWGCCPKRALSLPPSLARSFSRPRSLPLSHTHSLSLPLSVSLSLALSLLFARVFSLSLPQWRACIAGPYIMVMIPCEATGVSMCMFACVRERERESVCV